MSASKYDVRAPGNADEAGANEEGEVPARRHAASRRAQAIGSRNAATRLSGNCFPVKAGCAAFTAFALPAA
jgi:hypothetical protein